MKVTIVNRTKEEKTYTRVELDEFVNQLKDGTYHHHYIRDFNKDVCFAAEWQKQNGELKAKAYNPLIGRVMEEHQRFASFIATTTNRHPLIDSTGSPRWAMIVNGRPRDRLLESLKGHKQPQNNLFCTARAIFHDS